MLAMVIISIIFLIAQLLFVITLFIQNRFVASGLMTVSVLWIIYVYQLYQLYQPHQLILYKEDTVVAILGGCILLIIGILMWLRKEKLTLVFWIIFGIWLAVKWDMVVIRGVIFLVTIIGSFFWGKKKKFF
jgi:hypothetical protein